MLIELAWRNIWRQPQRTIISLSSIALASTITIFLLSLQQGTYAAVKESALRVMDGFAQVQPIGYADDPDIRKTISHPQSVLQLLDAMPVITAAAPRASSYAILSHDSHSYGAAVIGVDSLREPKVSTIPSSLIQGRFFASDEHAVAIVGSRLAGNLHISLGSQFTLLGSGQDGSVVANIYSVVGIFSTGTTELDRQLIEIPLQQFQSDFAMQDQINTVAVMGNSLAAIEASMSLIEHAAGDDLVVRHWSQLEPELHDAIVIDASFSSLLYVSLIAIVVFILLNTLLMSVLERTREFGMLLAIGMRPAQIGHMVWIELLILAGSGTLIGIVIGSALTGWFAQHGIPISGAEALFSQWHMPSRLLPRLDIISLCAGPATISFAIMAAGIVPYLRVRSLHPVTAMQAT